MEFKNDLGLVGKIAAHSVMSGKYKDKDGNIKEILPVGPGNSLDFDQFREDIGAFGGGSGGTDIDKEHPSVGADYYAGSLADGEITERNLEWSGTDDSTKDLTVTFKDDPGSNPFGQYNGLTILGHIQKTVMTSGTKGAVSNLELNYDPSNTAKDGYFTTTSPYPIYISQSDLASGQKLDVPISGIGEGLDGSNTKPVMIHLKYNSDRTMTISHEDGYVNDGNSAGATGANYSFVAEFIATFSTQKAVSQLSESINLFSGSSYGDIPLSGSTSFYENVMDGLNVEFDDYGYILGILPGGIFPSSELIRCNISGFKIKIPKEFLLINGTFDFSSQLTNDSSTAITVESRSQSSSYWSTSSVKNTGQVYYFSKYLNPFVTFKNGSVVNINFQLLLKASYRGNSAVESTHPFTFNVTKITPYKD